MMILLEIYIYICDVIVLAYVNILEELTIIIGEGLMEVLGGALKRTALQVASTTLPNLARNSITLLTLYRTYKKPDHSAY